MSQLNINNKFQFIFKWVETKNQLSLIWKLILFILFFLSEVIDKCLQIKLLNIEKKKFIYNCF